jgi:hypothetical protein
MIGAMGEADRQELSTNLDPWEVTLTTGDALIVRAHGVRELEDFYVFVALMKGSPAYEYELLRIPVTAVADVSGG